MSINVACMEDKNLNRKFYVYYFGRILLDFMVFNSLYIINHRLVRGLD